jgi:hypothetical protein
MRQYTYFTTRELFLRWLYISPSLLSLSHLPCSKRCKVLLFPWVSTDNTWTFSNCVQLLPVYIVIQTVQPSFIPFRHFVLRGPEVQYSCTRHEWIRGRGSWFDAGTRWRWAVGFMLFWLCVQGKSPRYPVSRRLGRSHSLCGSFWEGINLCRESNHAFSDVQPVASEKAIKPPVQPHVSVHARKVRNVGGEFLLSLGITVLGGCWTFPVQMARKTSEWRAVVILYILHIYLLFHVIVIVHGTSMLFVLCLRRLYI